MHRQFLFTLSFFFLLLPNWPAIADGEPNILLAISDDQSWMHAGAYGLDKSTKTPAFDRVAREGVLFNYAYCAAPSCAPSRAALLSGRPIWQLEEGGVLFGIYKAKFAPFTHLLEDAGYETAATGKTYSPGLYDKAFGRPLFGEVLNKEKLVEHKGGVSKIDYAANFESFLNKRNRDKPFFFWYGGYEPHLGYRPGSWKSAGKKLDDALVPACLPNHPMVQGEFLDYGIEIEHFDQHLARMISVLEEKGELENTIIIVTSDHGNPMPRSKCNLYDSGTRVPLAIRYPARVQGGRALDDFVGLWDLAPTILELAGVEPGASMAGNSLVPILVSDKSGQVDPERNFIVTAFERHTICRRDGVGYPMRSIRTHKWAYLRNYEPDRWPAGDPDFNGSHQGLLGDCDRGVTKQFLMELASHSKNFSYYLLAFGRRPAEELYDMQADPHQLNNLADDQRYAGVKKALAEKLSEYLHEHDDPRVEGENPWDRYQFTDERIFHNSDWRTRGLPVPLHKK